MPPAWRAAAVGRGREVRLEEGAPRRSARGARRGVMAALHRADALASAAAVLAKITTGCEASALPIGVSTVVLLSTTKYRDDEAARTCGGWGAAVARSGRRGGGRFGESKCTRRACARTARAPWRSHSACPCTRRSLVQVAAARAASRRARLVGQAEGGGRRA